MDKSRQQVTNFSRFYSLLRTIPYIGDRDDLKRDMVSQATSGRTEHLREMTRVEYNQCCKDMERLSGNHAASTELRQKRRLVLNLMKDNGVDTTDWDVINKFCISKKISGKKFRDLNVDELENVSLRLRMILKKKEKNGL
jgi:hypothetical protein